MVMSESTRVSFGVKTSQAGLAYHDILRLWREADRIPLVEHAWLWDHLVPLRGDVRGAALEAWTLLAALAAQTTRLRLGVIVTSNRIRLPAVLAKMAATVDVIAGGRLVFGIGAGGSLMRDNPAGEAMVRREYDAYGVSVVPPGEAVGALGEACAIVKRLWTEEHPFDFHGRYYQLTGTICEPKPVQRPHPPLLIGGGGEKATLRVVAEHADLWNCPARTAAEFRHKSSILDDHCVAIGRDPREIVRSIQILVACSDPSAPAMTRELLHDFIDAGARHLVLAPLPPYGAAPVQWLADEIIAPVIEALPER